MSLRKLRLIGEEYEGKEVYSVTFNHTETADSRNIIVYMDLDKKRFLGKDTLIKGKKPTIR